MRARILKAKFQGRDGSLGFHNGETYNITVKHQGGEMIVIEFNNIICEYQSLIAFLDNWGNIEVLGEPELVGIKPRDKGWA
jgi:hypothetical protein